MSKRAHIEMSGPPNPSIAIGIPSSRNISIDSVQDIMHWTPSPDFTTYIEYFPTAGRIDWGRSLAWEWAKKLEPDQHWQIDTDCVPLIPIWEAFKFIGEDFQAGFDCIIGPTCAAATGAGMFGLLDPATPLTGLGPMEVKGGAFGFVAFSPKLLKQLAPVGYIRDVVKDSYPIYGWSTDRSEDYQMCDNIRSQGFRICVDGRILVSHMKSTRMVTLFEDNQFIETPGMLRYIQRRPKPVEATA